MLAFKNFALESVRIATGGLTEGQVSGLVSECFDSLQMRDILTRLAYLSLIVALNI